MGIINKATNRISHQHLWILVPLLQNCIINFQANHERDPLTEGASAAYSMMHDPSEDHDLKKSEALLKRNDSYDVEKELEDELEKDLEGLNINDVDTTDVNLEDDDLLED